MKKKLILILFAVSAVTACTTKENSTHHDPEGLNSTQGPQGTVGAAGSATNPVELATPSHNSATPVQPATKGTPAPIVSPSPGSH